MMGGGLVGPGNGRMDGRGVGRAGRGIKGPNLRGGCIIKGRDGVCRGTQGLGEG